ncbi:hypothetical protein BKA62DRAFT_711400 [Auriculariales sp. MPI-PUGE-AT-0066]|nr:hypothetical protein BKA62DRAFT_711400 [Auriculariales sp. MPI-PUGE-AT-0066]
MTDETSNAYQFRKILRVPAEGICVWYPSQYGSWQGHFVRLFNVFDPPAELPPLPRPLSDDQLRSSELPNNGLAWRAVSCLQLSFRLAGNKGAAAFLVPGGAQRRVDTYFEADRFVDKWPYHDLSSLMILQSVTRSRGWHSTFEIGLHHSAAVAHPWLVQAGPHVPAPAPGTTLPPDATPENTIVVTPVYIRRTQRLINAASRLINAPVRSPTSITATDLPISTAKQPMHLGAAATSGTTAGTSVPGVSASTLHETPTSHTKPISIPLIDEVIAQRSTPEPDFDMIPLPESRTREGSGSNSDDDYRYEDKRFLDEILALDHSLDAAVFRWDLESVKAIDCAVEKFGDMATALRHLNFATSSIPSSKAVVTVRSVRLRRIWDSGTSPTAPPILSGLLKWDTLPLRKTGTMERLIHSPTPKNTSSYHNLSPMTLLNYGNPFTPSMTWSHWRESFPSVVSPSFYLSRGLSRSSMHFESRTPQFSDQSTPEPVPCERCKRLKVRCKDFSGEGGCKWCRNANAQCQIMVRSRKSKKVEKDAAARLTTGKAAVDRIGDLSGHAEGSDTSYDYFREVDEEGEEYGSTQFDTSTHSASRFKTSYDYIREEARKTDAIGVKVDVRAGYFFNPAAATSLPLANVPGADKLEILGVLTASEVDMMFKLFMDNINPYMSMFDEKLHTVKSLKTRSPFLLTVITMIASRYYTKRPDAYVRIMEIAKKLAEEAIMEMAQSIEHCQAFILLASYPAPDRKHSENKKWLYSGVAFRIATDIGLYKPQQLPAANERLEREALNRTRTWIVCFYIDESMSAHFGRPATISRDDPVVKNSLNWWKTNSKRYAHLNDVHLVLFVDLLRAFRTALDKGQEEEGKEVDHDKICREFDAEVAELVAKGETIYQETTDRAKPVCILRERMGDFTTVYSRLIIYSTAFQKGDHRIPEQEQECLLKCFDSAFRVLDILMNELASTGLLRYAPDDYFWYASFASAFLLKFLGPEHHDKVDEETRDRITSRVRELIDTLGSHAVAVDASHPPKLFSRFLSGMLSKHVELAQRVASNAGSDAPMPQRDAIAAGGSETGHTDGPVNTILSSEEHASTLATSPVASTGLPPAHSQSQPISSQGGLFGAGFDSNPFAGVDHGLAAAENVHLWDRAQDALMQEVDIQELHTGMFILDHPPWWNVPSLGIDLSALGVGSQSATSPVGGGMDFAAGGAGVGQSESSQFAGYDASRFSA